jgi:hypothetical protein
MKRHLWVLATFVLALAAAPAQAPDWQSYRGPGFTLSYPPEWKVDPNFLDKGYAFFQGQSDDVRGGIAFAPGYDLAPGSNLESDQLKLVVQAARPGDRCAAASFLVSASPDYETKKLIDKPDAVRIFAEPGDKYGIEQAVLIVSKAPCIAVHYYIAFERLTRSDPQGRKEFDREQLYRLLGAIAATVKPAP